MSQQTRTWRPVIATAAVAHDVDPLLVEAVVYCESLGYADAFRYEPRFARRYIEDNPRYQHLQVRRAASSYGLMQVMYSTAVEEGGFDAAEPPEMLFVPAVNLDVGCRVLARLLHWAEGDVRKALGGWNGGRGNWLGQRPQAYATRVLDTYRVLDDID